MKREWIEEQQVWQKRMKKAQDLIVWWSLISQERTLKLEKLDILKLL